MGAFHYAKIFGNFGREINGTLWSAWKFSVQSGTPPEGILFDRSVRSVRNLPFHFQKLSFSSPTLLGSSQNFGRDVNGSLDSIENFIQTEKCLSIFS